MKDSQSAVTKSPYLDKGFFIKLVVVILLVFAALGMYERLLKTFQVLLVIRMKCGRNSFSQEGLQTKKEVSTLAFKR